MSASELIEFSLEDLMGMDIEVTSAGKREEKSFNTAAAVSVISAEDIRRSGVTNIPDALRMAPGVQVGRINSNEWAVTVRGLSGRFARYLLVLVDGRSVYDPLFSGVNWDEVNIALVDIERIEIVRGPGAGLWGANAVNGVINIVTKAPDAVTGSQVDLAMGNQDKVVASMQGGWQVGEKTHVRVTGSHYDRKGFDAFRPEMNEDDVDGQRLSFAIGHRDGPNNFDVRADVSQLQNNALWSDARPSVVAATLGMGAIEGDEEKKGYALQFKWEHQLAEMGLVNLRFAYDDIERDSSIYQWDSSNADLDLEYIGEWNAQRFTVGINTRSSTSNATGTEFSNIVLEPPKEDIDISSFFIHNTSRLTDDWEVTVGGRYEYSSEAGDGLKGTVRSIWYIDERQRFWGSISKADSTPSRLTTGNSSFSFAVIPASPETFGIPASVRVNSGGEPLETAELIAIQAGYRLAWSSSLSWDLVLFRHEYRHLLSADLVENPLRIDPVSMAPYVDTVIEFTDSGDPDAEGVEMTLSWKMTESWYLQYAGSYLNYVGELNSTSAAIADFLPSFNTPNDVPHHQHSLRVMGDLSPELSLSLWGRYVDELSLVQIDSYATLDIRLDYRVSSDITVSAVAQNLGDNNHVEAVREAFYVDNYKVPESYYLAVNWKFR